MSQGWPRLQERPTLLLPNAADASSLQGYINEFQTKTIAIDVSCLLHRGMIFDHKTGEVLPDVYVRYVRKYVELFRAINCHVVLVFDGRQLPAKKVRMNMGLRINKLTLSDGDFQDVHAERRSAREFNQKRGEELLAQGRVKQAHNHFQRSATITRDVLETTIEVRKADG